MNKLITLYNIKNMDKLAEYADGFIIGSNKFSTRLTKDFSFNEINQIIIKAKDLNKLVFLNVNQMFTDKQLDIFENDLTNIIVNQLDGIIVADIGTFILLDKLSLATKVVYNPETLLTNQVDFNYLSTNNIKGAYIAKELTIEDIISIGNNKKYEMFMVGHGHLNMFYSKRFLLDNYHEFLGKEDSLSGLQNLKIIEPKREDSPYPIYQDKAGTHVFRSKVMNSFNYLDELSKVVDYLIIDTIFKDDEYGYELLKMYDNPKLLDKELIETKYQEKWDNGFLDNPTYYKRKLK